MATPERLTTMVAAVKDAAAAVAQWGEAMAALTRAEDVYKHALADACSWEDAQETYMSSRNIESYSGMERRLPVSLAHREVAIALQQKRNIEEATTAARLKAEKAMKKMSECVAASP